MGIVVFVMLAAAGPATIPAGTYTNEEDVYFAREADKPPPPWIGVVADAEGWRTVDAFGKPVAAPAGFRLTSAADGGLVATLSGGRTTSLRKARPATCWMSVKKFTPKPDGSDDYSFDGKLKLHDQGGRVMAGGNGAPQVVFRMRNVVWPSGTNRPSLVLYVHKPDNPDHAESYAWADPKAALIGINLRWVQGSCTIDGLTAPAASSKGGIQ